MKIAYLGFNNLRLGCGVSRKTLRQVTEWNRLGAEARLYCLSRGAAKPELDCSHIHYEGFSFNGTLTRFRALGNALAQIAKWKPDLIYLRMGPFYPQYFSGFRIAPTILEVNADDSVEYRKTKSAPSAFYHSLFRRFMFTQSAGCVFLTHELRERMSVPGKAGIVISNGIEKVHSRIPCQNANPRLFFIGSPGYAWHGIDKIFQLANLFPAWSFEIVGYRPEDLETTAPTNVRLRGRLRDEEFQKIAESCDLAIGTLALHRNEMNEACTLKVREYLGLGLPTIIGHKDTDELSRFPFVLELPNTEDSVSAFKDKIAQFANSWSGRGFDSRLLDPIRTEEKEMARIKFFQSVSS